MSTILVIDDDQHTREVVQYALEKAGYRVISAEDGKKGVLAFEEHKPDLVVLDVMMPEMEGTDVIKVIRADSDVPVIFLTARDEEIDRVVGLELGGDDYVTKPFSYRELVARVKAILRRSSKGPDTDERRVISYGNIRLDLDRYKATVGGEEVDLTITEFRILQTLLAHPGRAYSRDELIERAYPDDVVVSDRTIDGHIKRIRRKFEKLGAKPIQTLHGFGYSIAEIE